VDNSENSMSTMEEMSVIINDHSVSLEAWKNDTITEIFKKKNGPKRSLAVLSNVGAQSIYWGKQIVTNDPLLTTVDSKILTYNEVFTRHKASIALKTLNRKEKSLVNTTIL
jgi:hypothetical protein